MTATSGGDVQTAPTPLRPWWLVTAGLLGTAISAVGSWTPSLWGDEAASVMSAQRSLSSLFAMLAHVDAVHGGYYLGLHFWIGAVGSSPFAVRFPSAVAVGLSVVGVAAIAWRLSGRNAAIAAALICCVLPRVSYMGEEARSYAFSAAIAAWLTWLLVELLRRERAPLRLLVAYGALLALGIYVFLYLGLLILAHAIVVWMSRGHRDIFRRWLLACAAGVIAASPLAVTAALERGQVAYLGSRSEVTPNSLLVSLWFGDPWFAILAWVLIVTAVVMAALDRRARRRSLDLALRGSRMPRLEVVAGAWLIVPSVVLVLSHFVIADFTARYLSFCAPAAALLMGSALERIGRRRRWISLLALVAVIATAAPNYLSQRTPYAKNGSDWSEVSAVMAEHARPGDAVVFDESVRPSRRPRLASHTYPAGFAGLRDVTLRTPFTAADTWHDSAYSVEDAAALGRLNGVTTLWLIEYSSGNRVDRYGMAALAALGFTVTAHFRTHATVVYELLR